MSDPVETRGPGIPESVYEKAVKDCYDLETERDEALAAMAVADEREATLKRVEAERDLAVAEAEESEGERCRGVMVRREREREAAREVRALTEAVGEAKEFLAQAREVLRSRGTEPSGERAPIPWNLSNEIEDFLPRLRRLLAAVPVVAESDGRTDAD